MTIRMRMILGMLVTGLASLPARGATPPVYDLVDCIRAALAANPDLSAAAAELAGARARLAEARAGRYGQSEYTQVLGFVNRARGNPVFSPDDKNEIFTGLGPFTRLELEVNIPLWTFGKLDAALKAAQEALESQRAGGEAKRAEVIFSTKQLYYSLLLMRQLSGILHDMLDNMDKAVKKTQERLDAGSSAVTELDLLKLKTGRAKFAKGVLEVDASMGLARSALARGIGVEVTADFDIADRKLQPAAATIPPLEVFLAGGPERSPQSRQLASGIAAQAAKVDLEKAGYYPSVFLATGMQFANAGNRTNQTNPFAYDTFNYVRPVGVVGVHWDLNFFVTSAKVDQARAELDRLHAQQREATTGLALEIRRAYSSIVQARETMQVMEEGRKAGRGLLILSVSNFDLGIGEAEELFKALGSYTETSTDYFRAVYDYNVSLAVLTKTTGTEVAALAY
jgi:outer membrane protein TolC